MVPMVTRKKIAPTDITVDQVGCSARKFSTPDWKNNNNNNNNNNNRKESQ